MPSHEYYRQPLPELSRGANGGGFVGLLDQMLEGGSEFPRTLIVVAAAIEYEAVMRGFGAPNTPAPAPWLAREIGRGVSLVLSGVGKANAAGATAAAIERQRPDLVLSLGIGGTLDPEAPIGSLVAATRCVFADEGLSTPEGFATLSSIGFASAIDGDSVEVAEPLIRASTGFGTLAGPIATVSTCSATDGRRDEVRSRTGAIAEAMEGAAVALAAARSGIPACEIRSISNTTGDRGRQDWDIRAALESLSDLAGAL